MNQQEQGLIQYADRQYACAMERVLDRVGGKWKGLILWSLDEHPWRFNALRRKFPGLSQKMLTQQLRELEHDGLIHRAVLGQKPPHVEYTLTEAGKSFIPVLHFMNDWGKQHFEATVDEAATAPSGNQHDLPVES